MTPMVNIPDPVMRRWKIGDDGSLEVDWMDSQPAFVDWMDCQRELDEVFLNENVS